MTSWTVCDASGAEAGPIGRIVRGWPWVMWLLACAVLAMSSPMAVAQTQAYHEIERFVVNLAGERQARFLQITLQLEVADPKRLPDVQLHEPKLRDRLVQTLGGRAPESITGAEGREALRGELLEVLRDTLNDAAGAPLIEAVYFSNFIVQ
ncbi:MAG: flagellar basal body-associated protein FliL [Thioalkalivibrionaceae bacterium]